MREYRRIPRVVMVSALAVVSFGAGALARVPYPVSSSYTDTLRIGILCNWVATGTCLDMPPVGAQTMDFVVNALDSSHIKNIKVFQMGYRATYDSVLALFPGKLPHVLVHVNAGWGQYSGKMKDIFRWAAQYNVGLVEIGDDDAYVLDSVFDWVASAAAWGPMVTGKWLLEESDTLSVRLKPGSDRTSDSTEYPHLNGVIRNTAHRILSDSTLYFKPLGLEDGRCESDPDSYKPDSGYEQYADNITRLAYQQGYNAACDTLSFSPDPTCDTIIGAPDEWTVISLIEDSIPIGTGIGRRRAVSLSTQPQFFKDSTAAQQLVYDAVMYASLVHFGNPTPNQVEVPALGVRFSPRQSAQARPAKGGPGERLRVTDTRGRVVFDGRAEAWQKAAGKGRYDGIYVFTVTSASGTVRTSSYVVTR